MQNHTAPTIGTSFAIGRELSIDLTTLNGNTGTLRA